MNSIASGVFVGVCDIGLKAQGITGADEKLLIACCDFQLAGKDGKKLLGPSHMGLGLQGSAWPDLNGIAFKLRFFLKWKCGPDDVAAVILREGGRVACLDQQMRGIFFRAWCCSL